MRLHVHTQHVNSCTPCCLLSGDLQSFCLRPRLETSFACKLQAHSITHVQTWLIDTSFCLISAWKGTISMFLPMSIVTCVCILSETLQTMLRIVFTWIVQTYISCSGTVLDVTGLCMAGKLAVHFSSAIIHTAHKLHMLYCCNAQLHTRN